MTEESWQAVDDLVVGLTIVLVALGVVYSGLAVLVGPVLAYILTFILVIAVPVGRRKG